VLTGESSFVGRDRELAELRRRLVRAKAGSREAVLVEGEAGIGKTRLIEEAVGRALELGFTILRAAADETDRSRTYGPLLEAFNSNPDAGGRRIPEDLLRRAALTAADRRVVVIDELVSIVERASASVPVALFLDDLHWADPETLPVLRSLLRRTRTLPFAFVGAARPSPANAELERLVEAVTEAGGAHVVLDPLDDDAVTSLIEGLHAEPTPELRSRVASARGNPFFVKEVIAAVLDEPRGAVATRDLRRTVLRRLAHLSDDAKAVVRLASLLGPSIDVADLEAVLGRASIELVPVLDEAIKGGVLEDRGDVLAFRHDLLREAVYDDVPEPVRNRSHRDIARALAAAGAPARRVASHLARAAQTGDGEAVSWLRRAAAEEAHRSPAVAADMLGQAAGLLSPNDPTRDRLDAERAQVLAWAGRLAEASVLAAEVLSRLHDPELAAELHASLGESLFFRGRLVEAAGHIEQAAAGAPESRRGLLLAEAALSRAMSGQLHRADELAELALTAYESTMDSRARSLATSVRALLLGVRGDYTAVDVGRDAVRIADDDASGEAHRYGSRLLLGYALSETDRFDEAVAVLRWGMRLDEMQGVAWSLPCYHAALGVQYFVRGDWDDAVAELETAKELLDDMGSSLLGPQAHGLLAYIAAHRDDRTGAERELALGEADLAEAGPQVGAEWLVQTRVALAEDEGDAAVASAIVHGAWAIADAMGFRVAFRYLAPTYIRLALADGDREAARAGVEAVELLAETAISRSMAGIVLLCRGMLDADEDTLVAAAETLRGTARPLDFAVACEQASVVLAAGGKRARADDLRREAVAVYEALGAHRDIRRASAALRGAAADRKSARRERPVSGWDSLSPTERRVVALVAEGLSNAAVAERMFVSRRTVETHLYHLFAKLGVASRLELAVRATRELGEAEVQ
jgi:ATP/maltotriose-dependent transcriptional regulator MalT